MKKDDIAEGDVTDKFLKFSTERLQRALEVIKSQGIEGYTQEIGQLLEQELSNRTITN